MSGVGEGWWLGYDWASGELAPVLDAPDPRTLAYDADLDARLRAERSERGCDRRFYQRAAWAKVRRRVLAEWHGACADCLAASPARFTPATTVHHDARVEDAPGWALSEWRAEPTGGGMVAVRNLFPLCDRCHDARHGRVGPRIRDRDGGAQTAERW